MYTIKVYDTLYNKYVPLFSMEFGSLEDSIEYSKGHYEHMLEYHGERVHIFHNDVLVGIGKINLSNEFVIKTL